MDLQQQKLYIYIYIHTYTHTHTHILKVMPYNVCVYIYIYIYIWEFFQSVVLSVLLYGGARVVMVIVVGNGHGDTSLNHG